MSAIKNIVQIVNRIFRSSSKSLTVDLFYNTETPPVTYVGDELGSIEQMINKIFDLDAGSIKINIKYDLDQIKKDSEVIPIAITANVKHTETHTKGRPVFYVFVASTGETMPVTLFGITNTKFSIKIGVSGTLYYH